MFGATNITLRHSPVVWHWDVTGVKGVCVCVRERELY